MKRFFLKSVACLSIAFLLALCFSPVTTKAQDSTNGELGPTIQNAQTKKNISCTEILKGPADSAEWYACNDKKDEIRDIYNKPVSQWTNEELSQVRVELNKIKAGNNSIGWSTDQIKKIEDSLYDYEHQEGNLLISGEAVKGPIAGPLVTGLNWFLYAIQSGLSWIMGWVGKAVDTSIDYSKGLANQTEIIKAIKKSWVVFRDSLNLFFIFILLYISIQTILKGAAAKTKQMLANVIIAAMLINFSLLITNVIVDTSNIFTLAIYEKGESVTGKKDTITTQIMDSLELQTIDTIRKDATGKEILASASLGLTLVLLLKIVLTSVVLWAFLKILLLLITRLVVFLILMALSPIGFVGQIIPKIGEYSSKWWKTLTDQALVGPVFAFLITVSATLMQSFSNSDILKTMAEAGATGKDTSALVGLIFNLIICVGLIITTVNVTKKFSGEAGAFATGLVSKSIGSVAGLALGGVGGFAMRNIIGRGFAGIANSEKLKGLAEKSGVGGVAGRLALRATDKVSKSSFDVRSSSLGKTFSKETGINLGKGTGTGGFQKQAERSEKRITETAKLLERDMAVGGAGDTIARQRIKGEVDKRMSTDEQTMAIDSQLVTQRKDLQNLKNKERQYTDKINNPTTPQIEKKQL